MAESAVSSPNRRAFEAIMNCSAQSYSTRSTVNGGGVHCEKADGECQKRTTSSLMLCKQCVIGGISEFERDESGAQVMRERNGGGCDKPRPFSVNAIWAGIVLAKCRGDTVTSAQVSSGIGITHLCWGL